MVAAKVFCQLWLPFAIFEKVGRYIMVSQILAVLIFLVMFALIITEKIERHIVTLCCGLLMILLVFGITMHSGSAVMETLNIGSIFTVDFWHTSSEAGESSSGINWSTIIFIAGMMIMV